MFNQLLELFLLGTDMDNGADFFFLPVQQAKICHLLYF